SADKFALRKTLRRHRGDRGSAIGCRRNQPSPISATHIGKRLAGKLHEPFERAGGGRAISPTSPDSTPMKPGNAGGGKGPQFKTDARRGEGPGDWATYQLRNVFRNCRGRRTRRREVLSESALR